MSKRSLGLLVLFLSVFTRSAFADVAVVSPPFDLGDAIVGDLVVGATASKQVDDANDTSKIAIALGTGCTGFEITSPTSNLTLPTTVAVKYLATSRGTRTCTIVATSHSGGAARGSFNVTARGIGPHLKNPATIDIGDVRLNAGARTGTLVLENDGELAMNVTSIISNNGEFTVGSFPATITPGAANAANVTISFDPITAGSKSSALTITTDGSPQPVQTVNANGWGTVAIISVAGAMFGTTNVVEVGTTATTNITVSNVAAAANRGLLQVMSASISPSAGSWITFVGGNGCTGGTTACTFSGLGSLGIINIPGSIGVQCSPPANATGAQTVTVAFTSDTDSGGVNSTSITCTAGRADAVLVPAMAMFGDRVIGTTPTQNVVLTNMGNVPLTYSLLETDTGNQFSFTSTCTTGCSLDPLASATITTRFSPTSLGPKSASITVDGNDPDGDPVIPLTGNGVAPHASSNVASLPFGTIEVGKMGTPATLIITNTGSSALTLASAGLTAANASWSITGTIGAQPLAPNASRSFMINCIPQTHGTLDATFRVVSDSDAAAGSQLDIPLTCTGNQAVVSLNDNDHDFGGVIVGQTRDQAFTITNTGNVTLNNVSVALGGTGVGYTILASPFPVATVAPNGVINFTVRFAPLAGTDGGDKTFTFSGTWGTTSTVASSVLTVHGDGLVEGYDATPATVVFAQRFDAVTTKPVCITNTGDTTVIVTQLMLSLAAGTQTNEIKINNLVRRPCGTTGAGTIIAFPLAANVQLTAGQEVEAIVQFDPNNRVGTMGATITTSSVSHGTRQVTVTATSTTAMLTTNPGIVVNFGDTDLDAGPQTLNVTITNTGVANLDLSTFTRSSNGVFTTTLPTTAQSLAMGAMVTIPVTYTPTVERAVGQEDSFTISHNVSGDIAAPASQTITIRGRGVDRHIDLGAAPAFPPTFRNPGTAAPARPITIHNTGDAPLSISAVMVTTNDDIWHLEDTSPVTIPGQGSHDFNVTFTPKVAGAAPQGQVMFMNNDNTTVQTPMATMLLDGMGLDRNVALIGDPVDVGLTAIGLPLTLPDGLVVASMDANNAFTIREIQITDDATEAFSIADAPAGAPIAASSTVAYDVTFTPTEEGEFTAKAVLFLDEDPTQAAEVTLKGQAVFVDIGGGGGCSTGSKGGAGMVLVIAALFLARRRKVRGALAGAATIAVLAIAPAAHAQNANTFDLDLSLFDPTPTTTGTTMQVQSAAVGKDGDWVAGVTVSNATNPLVISYLDREHASITRRTMFEIGGAYAFLGHFEAGLRMPLYNQTGDGFDVGVASPNGTARGDLVAHIRAEFLRTPGPTELILGASLALTFPTASDQQYAGVDKPSGRLLGLLTVTPAAIDKRLTLTANLGAVLRAKSELSNIQQGSGLAFGGSASVRVLSALWLFGEVYGDALPSSHADSSMASSATMVTAEWLAGLTFRPDPRINIGLGAGRGLVSGLGTPDFRAVLAVSFTPGREELPPIHPPPPPFVDKDTDGDGIMDSADTCKDEREDMDAFQDGDGCPEPDNDKDNFLDSDDKCRDEAEDKDGFQDDDGCPELDNDADGVPDTTDKCPLVAEDRDGVQDDDGCPDKDNDNDGIEDSLDKCPAQAETINGNADEDGCPDAGDSAIALTPSALELMELLEFTGTKLKPSASRILGQVAATLKAHPEIVRIKVTVHVNPGGDEAAEKALTDERAIAIREWLIKAGIPAERVSGAGMGGTKPLLKGKKSPVNERVEIIILERK